MDDESVPTQPLKTTFSTGNFMEAYQTLLSESFEQVTIDISRHEYVGGFAFITFRVVPDNHSYKLRISGSFEETLPHNVTLIILATFPSVLHIDKAQNVKI